MKRIVDAINRLADSMEHLAVQVRRLADAVFSHDPE